MTSLKRLLVASVLILAAAAFSSAQTPPAPPGKPTRLQAGLGVLLGAPLGEFGNNIDSAGGVSGHLDVGLGGSVVSIGGEAAYLLYGGESRKVDLGAAIPDLPGVVVTVNTDNAMVLVHGRVRAQPRRGRWRPYVDGLFGFTNIYTTTSIAESGGCDGYSCTPDLEATNLEDFALSFGGGVGLMVGFGAAPWPARLDVSVRYLRGGEADYLAEGGIRREGGQAFLDISRSQTNMVLVYIGIAFGR